MISEDTNPQQLMRNWILFNKTASTTGLPPKSAGLI